MELTGWDVYWITRCDSIQVVAFIIGGLLGAVGLVINLVSATESLWRPMLLWIPLAGMFGLAVGVATPSTKEMCAILVVPAIVNNEDVQGLGTDIVDLARDWMKELRPAPARAEGGRDE